MTFYLTKAMMTELFKAEKITWMDKAQGCCSECGCSHMDYEKRDDGSVIVICNECHTKCLFSAEEVESNNLSDNELSDD